jgi:hypothetical protein
MFYNRYMKRAGDSEASHSNPHGIADVNIACNKSVTLKYVGMWIINCKEYIRKRLLPNFKVQSDHLPLGTQEKNENISQDSRCPGWGSNRELSECKFSQSAWYHLIGSHWGDDRMSSGQCLRFVFGNPEFKFRPRAHKFRFYRHTQFRTTLCVYQQN